MDTLKVGHGRECITPPMGIRMGGYGERKEGAADVHDDLFVDAVVLESPDNTVALFAYDLLWLDDGTVSNVRAAIREETGLDGAQVLLNWSHTHSGPSLGRGEPDEMQKAYRSDVIQKSVSALRSALADTCAATLSAGAAPVDIGCNRRVPREDGGTDLGHNPSGVSLHEMTVWRLARDEKPDVVLFSTPMHGTVLGGWSISISGDWMGRAVDRLERDMPDTRCVFLQSCAGDQDPYYSRRPEYHIRGTFGELEQHGRTAAASVRQALGQMHALDALPLRSVLRSVPLPPKEEGAEAPELAMHGIRIGDALIVAIGCEAVVEYALFGRKVSPAKATLVLGYSNGNIRYLPTAEMYPAGGLEVNRTRSAPEGEQIVKDAMQEVFGELTA